MGVCIKNSNVPVQKSALYHDLNKYASRPTGAAVSLQLRDKQCPTTWYNKS